MSALSHPTVKTIRVATVDYGCGTARLWGRFRKDDAERVFNDLASQCFGIRKNIYGFELKSLKPSKMPVIFRVEPAEMAAVLMHSGDVIVWGHDGQKIKSEFDK